MISQNTEVIKVEFVTWTELMNQAELVRLMNAEAIDKEIPFLGEPSTEADDITVDWPEGWDMDEVPF